MSDNHCPEHEKAAARRGIDASMHCWHRYDEMQDVCCWCGYLAYPHTDDHGKHGQYRPKKGRP